MYVAQNIGFTHTLSTINSNGKEQVGQSDKEEGKI